MGLVKKRKSWGNDPEQLDFTVLISYGAYLSNNWAQSKALIRPVCFLPSHPILWKAENLQNDLLLLKNFLIREDTGPVSHLLDTVLKSLHRKLWVEIYQEGFHKVWQPWSCWFSLLPWKMPPPHSSSPNVVQNKKDLSLRDCKINRAALPHCVKNRAKMTYMVWTVMHTNISLRKMGGADCVL